MPYVVMTRTAQMPSRCWGRYQRVALVQVAPGYGSDNQPIAISERSKGIVRIVTVYERCHSAGPRSAARIMERELRAEADRLNTAETALLTANL